MWSILTDFERILFFNLDSHSPNLSDGCLLVFELKLELCGNLVFVSIEAKEALINIWEIVVVTWVIDHIIKRPCVKVQASNEELRTLISKGLVETELVATE